MRHKILFGAAALLTFSLWPWAHGLPPAPAAALQLGLALLLSACASGEVNALGVASAAAGGLAASAIWPVSPALAGAALLGFVFVERTLRVRGGRARCAHLLLALGAGAAALHLGHRFGASAAELRVASLSVAAALAALPLLMSAEDPIAHLLSLAAERSRDQPRAALEEAAALRRWLGPRALSRPERRPWEQLAALVRQRVALGVASPRDATEGFRDQPPAPLDHEQAEARKLDAAIASAVETLRQVYAPAGGLAAAQGTT